MKTVKTSEINDLDVSDKPCGSTINVWNTVFTVKKNDINNAGYYALSLAHLYYVKTTDKASDMQSRKDNKIRLSVKSDASYNSNEYLVSEESTTPNYIFKFVESNIKDATELLSAEGKSVYNIQIGDDLFLENHMVQAGTYSYFATGSAMADLNSPAYQFVITKVSDAGVTFTNRASGNTLTVKLYERGDYYSLAYTGDKKFEILNIQNNGDVKKRIINSTGNTELSFHRMPVQLIPAETEAISGWNVADGTQVTIAFARDNAPTSNKMYPQLNAAGTDLDKIELTDDVFEAVQWQLEKSSKPKYTTYTYAYLDKNEKVAYKTKGDTIAYYMYNFRLVDDGNVTDKYLQKQTSTTAASSANAYSIGAKTGAGNFIISTDWDYSEIITIDGKAFISVNKHMQNPYADIDKELTRCMANNSIQTLSYANQIKTYLVQDAPAVSLPATATYVTLQGELGNYIAMDGEKDGIVISNEPLTYRVFATDLDAAVPSFLISTGFDAEDKARNFLFNPEDSVNYYVGAGAYDKNYEWAEDTKKAIFKSGILSESNDTMTTSIKGKVTEVAMKSDNKGTKGGLNRFKYQIVLADAEDDLYVIRQIAAGYNGKTQYLSSINDKLTWVYNEPKAMKFVIADTVSPTANEAIEAAGVQVIGGQGVVTVQGAAGKVITVANILGQTIANQVATSDNVTIAAPAGVVVVAVEGEATKVVVK